MGRLRVRVDPLVAVADEYGIGETESLRSGVPHVAGLERTGVLVVSSNVGGSSMVAGGV